MGVCVSVNQGVGNLNDSETCNVAYRDHAGQLLSQTRNQVTLTNLSQPSIPANWRLVKDLNVDDDDTVAL